MGSLTDPFGHKWSVATHTEDVNPEQMRERLQEFTAKRGQKQAETV
jgi:PhnB protein